MRSSRTLTTPYRNEIDALRERKASLEQELAKLKEETSQLDELRARETDLAKELAGVDGKLRDGGTKRALPLLDNLRIASPCKADWNEMLGDERVRFCLSCEKNVYNLSSMTSDAAEALLRERLGNDLCVRFYQRADGTMLTQDCPVGVKKKRRRNLAIAIAGAGALTAAAVTAFGKTTCHATTGAIAAPTVAEGEPMMGDVEVDPGPLTEVKGDPAPEPTVMGRMAAPARPAQPKTMGKPAAPKR